MRQELDTIRSETLYNAEVVKERECRKIGSELSDLFSNNQWDAIFNSR